MKKNKIVFHIDDDEDDRMFFREAFGEPSDITLRQFETFEDALKGAESLTPDILYTDFWIPGMTAPQFLKALSERVDMNSVTVYILSGTEVPYFFRELLQSYRVEYFIKPDNYKAFKNLLLRDIGTQSDVSSELP